MSQDVPAVEAVNLVKSFGGVRALQGASLAAAAGEVHALVGENGAGKSTVIKALGGRVQPDGGEIRIGGRQVRLPAPPTAHALGAWTVFQELTLLPGMTVAENLLLAREPRTRLGLVDRRRLAANAESVLAGLGVHHIDPRALVEDIPLAERQMVEIVRAISHDPRILFLDEPTSSLVEREVVWLFGQIRRLRAKGACIVFTSHRWNEIRSIADRITVFRGGRDVGCFTELSEEDAVTLMTGQRVETFFPPLPAAPRAADHRPALEVRNLAAPRLRPVSFAVAPGEVLGIGGLAGHGHRELFLALFGAGRATGGQVLLDGKPVRLRNPREAERAGIALVPEDRKSEGLLLPMSVRDNLSLALLRRLSRAGLLRRGLERQMAGGEVQRLKVRTASLAAPVGTLSGGNQQKVLLGRWLLTDPRVLLLYDVTRGVDVATKHEIFELMMRLAGEGRAILFYSSDAEELAHLGHRVLVMREGRMAAELRAPGITAEHVVSAAVRDAA
ncbi:MAG: sugar ABC transporter ATP-binding protein [Acetobacteraceae bacterium]|nr:sugar ABC transporter ATP-binding protein [Acetobacteraceae bacterium]